MLRLKYSMRSLCWCVTQSCNAVIKLTFPLNTLIGTTFPCKSFTVKEWKSVHSIMFAPKPTNRTKLNCQTSISCKSSTFWNMEDLGARRLVPSMLLPRQRLSDQLFWAVKVITNHSECCYNCPIRNKQENYRVLFNLHDLHEFWEKWKYFARPLYEANLFHFFCKKMSHFSFETEVNDLLRLDGPMNRGPAPRYQRKSAERRCSSATSSTPTRNPSRLNSSKTPSKTPKSLKNSPRKAKTPSEDRFIPNRSAMNFEANYYKMVSADHENQENECASPSKAEFKKNMAENLGGNEANARILAFKNKAPTPREGNCLMNSNIYEFGSCLIAFKTSDWNYACMQGRDWHC